MTLQLSQKCKLQKKFSSDSEYIHCNQNTGDNLVSNFY